MKRTLLLISVCTIGGTMARAQSVGPSTLNATGGSATIGGSTFEYAVGDVVAGNTFTSPSLVVTPGVLQPVQATGINNTADAITGLQVYPSPADAVLYIQPNMGKGGSLQYGLYDAAGKMVLTNTAVLQQGNERQQADVHTLAAGQYMLQVQWLEGGNVRKGAYKIQKLQ